MDYCTVESGVEADQMWPPINDVRQEAGNVVPVYGQPQNLVFDETSSRIDYLKRREPRLILRCYQLNEDNGKETNRTADRLNSSQYRTR